MDRGGDALMNNRMPKLLFLWMLVTLALVGCRQPAADLAPTFVPPATPAPDQPERTYTVVRGDVREIIETRGRVTAKQEALLVFPMSGALKAVHVIPGDQVAAGEPLAELDAPNLEQQVLDREFALALAELQVQQTEASAEASLSAARNSAAVAQAQYDKTMLESQLTVEYAEQNRAACMTSAKDDAARQLCETSLSHTRQRAEATRDLAQAQLNAAYAELNLASSANYTLSVEIAALQKRRAAAMYEQAQRQLEGTVLTAPFSGIVLSVEKRAGDQVGPYESLGMIADPSELWVVATIPEQDIDRVAVGQAAQVVLDAYLDDVYEGKILQIANQAVIWQGKKAYEVTITFDDDQEVPTSIRMGADVVIITRAQEDVVIVPDEAIMMSGGRAYVEVVEADGALRQVDVELGISNGVETEIISGLEAGQTIRLP